VTDGNTKEPAPTLAQAVTEAVWSEGLVLLPPAGVHGNVIRLAPPLVISDDEAMDGLSRLRSVLERIGSAQ